MLLVTIVSFALFIAAVTMIAAPLLRPDPADVPDEGDDLSPRRQRLLTDIRELDHDLATGKLDTIDHERFRATALAELASTIEAMDQAGPPIDDAREPDGEAFDVDAWLESKIAERRQTLQASPCCPECEAPRDPGDAFCRRCGAPAFARATKVT